jgi:ACR3 family arsenite efflux pump ArsB
MLHKTVRIVGYVLLLIPSLVFVAALWTFAIAGRLYYCWDNVPLVDFVPPFVHSELDARDHYIASAGVVWGTWVGFLLLALVLPLLAGWVVRWILRAWRGSLRDGTTI